MLLTSQFTVSSLSPARRKADRTSGFAICASERALRTTPSSLGRPQFSPSVRLSSDAGVPEPCSATPTSGTAPPALAVATGASIPLGATDAGSPPSPQAVHAVAQTIAALAAIACRAVIVALVNISPSIRSAVICHPPDDLFRLTGLSLGFGGLRRTRLTSGRLHRCVLPTNALSPHAGGHETCPGVYRHGCGNGPAPGSRAEISRGVPPHARERTGQEATPTTEPSLEDLAGKDNLVEGLDRGGRAVDRPIPGSSRRRHTARTRGNSRRARTPLKLEIEACKVLAPQAFVSRLGVTLPLRNLNETLLRSRPGWPTTSNEVFKDGSVPLKYPNLGFQEHDSRTTKCKARRRLGHRRCPGEALRDLLTAMRVHQQQSRRGLSRTRRTGVNPGESSRLTA